MATGSANNAVEGGRLVTRLAGVVLACLGVSIAADWAHFGHFTLPNVDPWAYLAPFIVVVMLAPEQRAAALRIAILGSGSALLWQLSTPHAIPAVHLAPMLTGLAMLAWLGLEAALLEHRARPVFFMALGVLLPAGQAIGGVAQHFSTLNAATYDAQTYLIDLSLGINPVQIVLDLFDRVPALSKLCWFAYVALPVPLAIVPVAHIARRSQAGWQTAFFAFVAAGAVGSLIYQLYPITGPRFALDMPYDADFHAVAPSREGLSLGLHAITALDPRNGMPSLHTSWMLLALMNTAGLALGLRLGVLAATGLVMLATLGLGQHYLVDLIVALPFSIAIQTFVEAVMARRLPGLAFWLSSAMTGAWLWALLEHAPQFLAVPGLTTTAYLATAVLGIGFIAARFRRAETGPSRLSGGAAVGGAALAR